MKLLTEVRGHRTPLLIGIGLALLTAGVYAQVVTFSFIGIDDPQYVVENIHVRQGISISGLRWALTTTHASNWHPLTWLSLMLDAEMFGDRAGGFHLTNLVIHLANVELLFFWLYLWTKQAWPSAFVAALFAVHPQHAESVAWVAERKDVLSTMFGLLTILAYGIFLSQRSVGRYILILIAYLLSLLSKPMFVTLPVLLFLLDVWPLERWYKSERRQRWRLVQEKIPLFLVAGMVGGIAFYAQRVGGAVSAIDELSIDIRVRNGIYSTAIYLFKTIVPTGLVFYYPHPLNSLTSMSVAIAGGVLILITLFVIRFRLRYPFLLVGWLWYLIALLPVIGIVQIGKQGMADRYMYVPHIGIFLMLGWGFHSLLKGAECPLWISRSAGVVVVGIYAMMAVPQVGHWRNGHLLAEHALAVNENNAVALLVLGEALMRESHDDAALASFQKAASLAPDDETVQSNIGLALERLGRPDEALEYFRLAAKEHPQSIQALSQLGRALIESGAVNEGIAVYQRVLQLEPELVGIHNNLAQALFSQGDAVGARKHFAIALAIDSSNADVRTNHAVFCAQQGRTEDAIAELRRVLAQDPTKTKTRATLATLLASKGMMEAALGEFRSAMDLDPTASEVRTQLARALYSKGEIASAIAEYRQALKDDPGQQEAANDLAWILATSEKYQSGNEAVQLMSKISVDSASAAVLDTLAAANAANGDFTRAIQIAEQAALKARAARDASLAEQLEFRVKLYRSHQRYRDPTLP